MKIFLFASAILFFLVSVLFFKTARTAIDDISALLLLLISFVSFSGAGIIHTIQKVFQNNSTDEDNNEKK